MNPLLTKLEQIRTNLRARAYPNERVITSTLVKVILRELGWDTDDFRAVYEEFKAIPDDDRKKVDLALFAKSDLARPCVYIEVKDHGKLQNPEKEREAETQLWEYDRHNRVKMAVLTDGQIWHFYYSLATGKYSDRRAYSLDLLSRTPEDCEHYLKSLLSFERIKSAEAFEHLKKLYDERNEDAQTRSEFPEVWQWLLKNSNDSFLEGVSSAFQQLKGRTPKPELLKRLLAEVATATPRPEPTPRNEGEDEEGNDEGHRAARSRIKVRIAWNLAGKSLPDEHIERGTASSTLVSVIERLTTVLGQSVLEKLSRLEVNRGPLVTRSPNRNYQHKRLEGTGFWVLTHSATTEKVEIVKKISTALNLPSGTLRVEIIET